MNENLQNALVEILIRAISGIDSSVAFMQAELPDVVHELLLWYGVKGILMCFIGVTLIVAMVKVDILAFKKMRNSGDFDFMDVAFFYGAIGSIVRLVYLFPIGMLNLEWLQIWIAPKIWLMEYAAELVK